MLYKNNIPLNDIVAYATDEAPSMVGRYRVFFAYVKEEVSNVLCIHYVHRQHLVRKHYKSSFIIIYNNSSRKQDKIQCKK